ncbi:MAG TPA: precorrin-6y C5,15-methyltransferase (decarboxylating) subunit CbiE [Rhizobiaceae bacterium]|nr:precorrin-6y C5,15-methyltransferase (decarboxylating) subunit CbiE [Rhizobiaceae bacterium]
MSAAEKNVRPTNSTPTRWLSIVGIGEDGIAGLSTHARALIEGADLVVGGARHLALVDPIIKGERLAWPTPIEAALPEILRRRGRPVAVLATGDPFHYGIGKQIAAVIPADEFICIPQPSAFALAAARLGWALQDVALVSLHGRALAGVIRYLQPGARILALSWDGETPAKLATLLMQRGLGTSRLTVLESMGGERERVRHTQACSFDLTDVSPLNTIAIEVAADADAKFIPLATGLDDDLFETDGQLTKRELRSTVLSSLAPRQGELLWDIGLGAGSVAIEWLLRHPSMRAIGIEADSDRADRAARNAQALGTPDLQIMKGHAPATLAGLPAPDAVFIGGGLGDGCLEAAWHALKPGGRLVANAVTLEGEQQLLKAFADHGGELMRIVTERASPVGTMHAWRPALPIVHWRMKKPC